MNTQKEIGLRIRKYTKEKKITLEQLSKCVGLSGKSSVNSYERGVSFPTIPVLCKICKELEIEINQIIIL